MYILNDRLCGSEFKYKNININANISYHEDLELL